MVQRDFAVAGPNLCWVASITYLSTWAETLYLAAVADAWSRRMVGWAMTIHLGEEPVLDTLEMAIRQRLPRSVIHRSLAGSQYTSLAFGQCCR